MDNLLLLTFPCIVLAFISRVVILKRWNHSTSHLLKIWDVNRMEAWCLDSISLRWDQSLYCCLFASCCNQLSWLNNFVNRYVSQCICYTCLIASCTCSARLFYNIVIFHFTGFFSVHIIRRVSWTARYGK